MQRILYVDDEPDIREVAVMSLELAPDWQVRSAASGTEALPLAAEWQPDLILLDVMMPDMDGPMTLKALQTDERTQHIPVVFVTARTQPSEIQRFRELGVRGIVAKPFDPMTLAGDVRAFLS